LPTTRAAISAASWSPSWGRSTRPANWFPDRETFPKRASRIIPLAVDSFNRGVRAHCFGPAALGWFIHPWGRGLSSIRIALVPYRREFRSRTLGTLVAEGGDPFAGKDAQEQIGKPR
jgi:uncharacterized membrane protein